MRLGARACQGIGPKQHFMSHSMGLIMVSSTSGKTRGPWVNVNNRGLEAGPVHRAARR